LRMAHNLSSGLDVLVSEHSLLLVQDSQISTLGSTVQAILSLIKALGGGYQACYIDG
jgi:outer membrane protein TolC